ncbi:hypothetical protein TTHNP3_00038 (plasmid) [Thermus thermophilus]|uniref:Uncharacterized protein n=1 Tax=Thermus thermophilus TaxID=274 RepID=A0A3P4ATP5_THETH|nr:hypothetical protein [Thermus thermophilus]VCU54525.1 hypothetical protein TTHNP3_00038 [Thermus thermophilus]
MKQKRVKGADWRAQKDRARYRRLRGGLNLKGILREAFGDWDLRNPEARMWAAAAWHRLDRARALGRHGLPKRDKHAAFALLKGLVGEGYLRPEPFEPPSKLPKGLPDPVLAQTAYRPTKKARAFFREEGLLLEGAQAVGGEE